MQKLIVLLVTIIILHSPGRSQQKLFDRPVQLKSCKISIHANAFVATTDMELEFYNNNDNEVEGKQYFFLDRGQVVTGFQLELNGKFRDGSIEEKRKANNAYNRIVGKRIDPAILQMYNQDQYTLNIYPVPAHGSRKVRIKILQLMKAEAQGVDYRLPLNFSGRTERFVLDISTCSDGLYPVAGNGLLQEKLFVQGRSQGSMNVRDTGVELNKVIAFSLLTVTNLQQLFVANVNEQKNTVKYSSPDPGKINIEQIRSLRDAAACDPQLYNNVLLLKAYDSIMYGSSNTWNKRLIFGLLNKVITPQTSYLVLERLEDYINYKIEPPKELERQCADMNYVYNNESLIRALMEEEKMPTLAYVMENYNEKIHWWDEKGSLIDLTKPVISVVPQDRKTLITSPTNNIATGVVAAMPGNGSQELTAVVVTALSSIRTKASLGYATSFVRYNEFRAADAGNLPTSIAGKVPGLTVMTANNSLGQASSITLMGSRSLRNNNPLLFVVDGARTNLDQLNFINPADIIDITVLRSPAATGIYGSEGANGVLLVRTKKGLGRYRQWSEYTLSNQADVEYIEEMRKHDRIDMWETYKEMEKLYATEKSFYIDMADYFFGEKLENDATAILNYAAERFHASKQGMKTIAYTLERWRKFDEAISIYKKIIEANSYDLATKKDLALAYYQKGEYQRSLDMYYNVIITEPRHSYDDNLAIKAAAMDEMNALIAIHKDDIDLNGINRNLIKPLPVDLSISVESNNSIYNFQIVEPGGEQCNYEHNTTQTGGYFPKNKGWFYSQDVCQYMIRQARKGKYRIKIDVNNNYYYDSGDNVPKMIRVIAFKNFQTKDQTLEIKNIILDNQYGVVVIDEVNW